MHRAEELLQDPMTRRVELPHILSPALTRENPAKKHHLDHASKAGVLVYYTTLDAVLQCCHLVGRRPIKDLFEPGCKPHGKTRLEFTSGGPCGVTGLGDVEPPLLLSLDGFNVGPPGPVDVGKFAHHGAAAFRVLAFDHLRLHIEDLEP